MLAAGGSVDYWRLCVLIMTYGLNADVFGFTYHGSESSEEWASW